MSWANLIVEGCRVCVCRQHGRYRVEVTYLGRVQWEGWLGSATDERDAANQAVALMNGGRHV